MNAMEFDVAILGAGFAGSLLAMVMRRLGRSVLLLERGQHPRFAIGESSTPLANWLLADLSDRYDLPRIRPLSKWGTWQRTYPQIGCGLKRGFSFFHHTPGEPLRTDSEHTGQLLVAASAHDGEADTHWFRADFDEFLMSEARQCGAVYLDRFQLQHWASASDGIALSGERSGQPISARAKLVIDASGPRGVLHRQLNLPEAAFEHLPGTQALFSHFRDVKRLADMDIFPSDPAPPYPVDDAAVHHVFDGGWIWVLRFNNGLTSAGVAMQDGLARQLRLAEGSAAWDRLLARFPSLADQFGGAGVEFPFVHLPRVSFRSGRAAGPNWAMLPSAAGFLDPLLSTGFTLTLLGVSRLADAVQDHWGSGRLALALAENVRLSELELLAAERVVAALYASMHDFALFRHLSTLYFASVSWKEISERLKDRPPGSFLLHDDPTFGPKARWCCEEALRLRQAGADPARRQRLIDQIRAAIAPIDRIGLSDSSRKHWHPGKADLALPPALT